MDKWTHSGSLKKEVSQCEKKHRALARRAAAEGIVLLKNDGVLPLKLSDPIALFGNGAEKTVKGGIGSGDVNNRENISVYRGIKEAGAEVTDEDWIRDYDRRYKEAREMWKEKVLEDAHHVQNPFDAYAANPFVLPDGRTIKEKDLSGAVAAVYVISRISGEGKDRRLEKGDYYLSSGERKDILYLNRFRIPLILILNSGGPVEITDILQEAEKRSVRVQVAVTNTGNCYAGREVVQVYISLPQGGLEKESRRLAGFTKTDQLDPGESREVTVMIRQKQLAVFSEERQAWIAEAGIYGIWVGNSIDSAVLSAYLTVPQEVVLEKTHRLCPRKDYFEELCKDSFENGAGRAEEGKEEIPVYEFEPCIEPERQYVSPSAEDYAMEYGIRSLIMADGPAGLRLRQSYQVDRETDSVYSTGVLGSLENGFLKTMKIHENADTYYQYCTAFPVGTALAQTWDPELLGEFGRAVAEEMRKFHVDLWLAPGMNIQRNPLCGRNFEYFSEDPLLTGVLASAVIRGGQGKKGCGVTIKHFACNNQEDNRMRVDACVSERALREIYLRGFEIAVKEGAPAAIVSSYNLINGVHAANSRDLCTVAVREEWGFDGVIMSDWNTTVPDDGSIPWRCAAAGNDIIMPGNCHDDENIREAYTRGELSETEIRECAGRIITLVKKLSEEAQE